jgi:hypothetical protein
LMNAPAWFVFCSSLDFELAWDGFGSLWHF